MSGRPLPKLAVVIPACNEASTIGQVLSELLELELPSVRKEIVVVDDGSNDQTAAIAQAAGVLVVRHIVQRGLGGALGTGIDTARLLGADLIMTLDADGQHAVEDIPEVIGPLLRGEADVVIGSRMADPAGMPWPRRIANHVANFVTRVIFGVNTTDSQSGFRALSGTAASKITISANHYEVSSEIFREIRRHSLRLVEIPIRSIYTRYSLSKGQRFRMGVKTLVRLILYKNVR